MKHECHRSIRSSFSLLLLALALNGTVIKGKKVTFEMEKITAERTRNLYLLNLPEFNNTNNKAIRDIFSRLGIVKSFTFIKGIELNDIIIKSAIYITI
jgi:hypothetical protein